jgi:hypothetical protein
MLVSDDGPSSELLRKKPTGTVISQPLGWSEFCRCKVSNSSRNCSPHLGLVAGLSHEMRQGLPVHGPRTLRPSRQGEGTGRKFGQSPCQGCAAAQPHEMRTTSWRGPTSR